MPAPDLTLAQVQELVPDATEIQELDRGGQKAVFTGIIHGRKYALKFLSPAPQPFPPTGEGSLDLVAARAQREVETIQQCQSPYLVQMGPVGLGTGEVNGAPIFYYSEEFVEGKSLRELLASDGPMQVDELVALAYDISEAISAIWQFSKVHRDIKPGNIMKRAADGRFILLDMGLVFDLQDSSLSVGPVGTPLYFSPEQMDFANRRTVLNFRSDLFSLGIVLYEMATATHPFVTNSAKTTWDVLGNIVRMTPEEPVKLRPDLPPFLNEVILRLLAKRPALRFRSIGLFQQALGKANGGTVK